MFDVKTTEVTSFFVPGVPQSAGSKQVFWNKKTGKPIVAPDNPKAKDWKSRVVVACREDGWRSGAIIGALAVRVTFYLPRPVGHYGTGRNADHLRAAAPKRPEKRPDSDKLLRPIFDALTKIVWRDDAQIVEHHAVKFYATSSQQVGAYVEVARVDG